MKHIDLFVLDGDFFLDSNKSAETVDNRATIAQDIKHRLIISGLTHLLIGENNPLELRKLKNRILIEVEKDRRIKPGTAEINQSDAVGENLFLTADTIEFGPLRFGLQNS